MSLGKLNNLDKIIKELQSLSLFSKPNKKPVYTISKEKEELELNSEDNKNYTIEDIEAVIPKGKVGKFIGNMEAFMLLKRIQKENRTTINKEEQNILSKYIGWGGLADVFKFSYLQYYDEKFLQQTYAENPNISFVELSEQLKNKSNYAIEYSRMAVMKFILSDEEYLSARNSTFNAHYTSLEVVQSMWDFLLNVGYKGGKVLESSAGIGYFLGLMPTKVRKYSQIYAIEKEQLSGNILNLLYPSATIQVKGFEEANLPYGKFNLVIGNPPFGQKAPYDKDFKHLSHFSLHNYFIAKSISSLKAGGICMVVTSMSTMDSSRSKLFREWVVDVNGGNTDFLGAVRLPSTSFEDNAGTQVVTDILIFRKRDSEMPHPLAQSFLNTTIIGEGKFKKPQQFTKEEEKSFPDKVNIYVNEYYARFPEMMLGEMRVAHEVDKGGLYDPNELTCYAQNLDIAQLKDRFQTLAKMLGNIFTFDSRDLETEEETEGSEKVGTLVVKNNKVFLVTKKGSATTLEPFAPDIQNIKIQKGSVSVVELVKDYLQIKNTLLNLLDFERQDKKELLETFRKTLNNQYDLFIKKYGFITKNKNLSLLKEDIEYSLVESLELPTNTKDVYQKADVFSKRILFAQSEPTSANNIQDAFNISLNYKGRIDIDYMAYLLKIEKEEVKRQITQNLFEVVINGKTMSRPLAFVNPVNMLIEEAEEYLSGKTKEKLAIAQKVSENNTDFIINVQFLLQSQPTWLTLDKISYSLSSVWIPNYILEAFAKDIFKVKIKVSKSFIGDKVTITCDIQRKEYGYDKEAIQKLGVYYGINERTSIYTLEGGQQKSVRQGTVYHRTGWHLFEMMLNNKETAVNRYKLDSKGNFLITTDKDGKETYQTEIDEVVTQEVENKKIALNRLFSEFITKNKDYISTLEQVYNDTYNNIYERVWEEPKIDIYPGSTIKLRPQQKIAVKRGLRGTLGGFLGVGVGKTYTIITLAMELKRLKLSNKPLIVVQNATLEQFVASARKAYPLAKILAPFNANAGDDLEDDEEEEKSTKKESVDKILSSRKNRRKLYSKIALNDWDMIIIPQSQFNLLPDLPERIKAEIENQMQDLEELMSKAQKEKDTSATSQYKSQIKQLEKRLQKIKEQEVIENLANAIEEKEIRVKDKARKAVSLENRLKRQADRKVDDFIYFEHLGIDSLLIDEFHAYKRIGFATEMHRIKGIDTQGSQRTLSTMLKIKWIYQLSNGERNVSGWTGTPISNTMAEMWTMTKLLKPSLLNERMINAFDAFANTHCEVVSSYEMDAGGNYKSVSRLAKYKNMPELFQMWKSFAYVVISADALGKSKTQTDEDYLNNFKVGEHIPLLELQKTEQGMQRGFTSYLGKRGIEQSRQVTLFKYLLDWYNVQDKDVKKEYSYIPLVVFGEARKSTIDLRLLPRGRKIRKTSEFENGLVLFNHNPRDIKDGKVFICAENVAKVYFDENKKGTKGTQLIFCDLYSRKQKDEYTGKTTELFNVYDEIKQILIEKGVPANEIAIAGEGGKKKRLEMFEKVNEGVIRICLGSTHTLGTGVNVQKKLIAIHHIDAPLRPMDFEQRNGRILRAGNENKVVQVFTYGIEQTLDAVAYKRLQIKQTFINQIMKGETNGQRTIEDEIDDTEDFFETLSASLTGSTARIDQIKAEKELRLIRGQIEAEQQAKTKREVDLTNGRILLQEFEKRKIELENEIQKVNKSKKEGDDKFTIHTIDISAKVGNIEVTHSIVTGEKEVYKELDKKGKEVEKKKEVSNTEQLLKFYKKLYNAYFKERFGEGKREISNKMVVNLKVNEVLDVSLTFELKSDNVLFADKMNFIFAANQYSQSNVKYDENNYFVLKGGNTEFAFYFTIFNNYTRVENSYSNSPTDLLTKLTTYFREVEKRYEENNIKIEIKKQEIANNEKQMGSNKIEELIKKEKELYDEIPKLRMKADEEKSKEVTDLSFVFDGSMRGLGSIQQKNILNGILGMLKPELEPVKEDNELVQNIENTQNDFQNLMKELQSLVILKKRDNKRIFVVSVK